MTESKHVDYKLLDQTLCVKNWQLAHGQAAQVYNQQIYCIPYFLLWKKKNLTKAT